MAKWMSGKPTGIPTSGWLGRWLDGYLNGSKDLFAAAEVGHSLPFHMVGEASRATAIPASRPSFGARPDERYLRQYQTVRNLSSSNGLLESTDRSGLRRPTRRVGADRAVDPGHPSGCRSRCTPRSAGPTDQRQPRLSRARAPGWGDFDSHAGQPDQHPARMQELNAAIRRFYDVLDPVWSSRVTFMTFSEFGRTSQSNDGAGTDHGTTGTTLRLRCERQGRPVRSTSDASRDSGAGAGWLTTSTSVTTTAV